MKLNSGLSGDVKDEVKWIGYLIPSWNKIIKKIKENLMKSNKINEK